MGRRPGRPVSEPNKPVVTLTLRVSRQFKQQLISQSSAAGLSLTAYLKTLVERDGTKE